MTVTKKTVQDHYNYASARLPSLNSNDMRRLVGYLEYTRALSLLDPLVASASSEELKLMDQIVASRPEYTVYTNISRRIPKQVATSLDEPAAANDTFAKRGLAWVMALARVELGAMLAGYTGQREPFAVLPPTRFEMPAYAEMLTDGARVHYWSLRNDPVVALYASFRNLGVPQVAQQFGRQIDESQAIAYGRRVALAREFVQAVAKLGRDELTPPQKAELATWDKEMQELIDVIAYKVLAIGDSVVRTTGTSTSVERIKKGDILRSCPFLRCDEKGRPNDPRSTVLNSGGGNNGGVGSGGGNPAGKVTPRPTGVVGGAKQPATKKQ